jgi:hypothetical protein
MAKETIDGPALDAARRVARVVRKGGWTLQGLARIIQESMVAEVRNDAGLTAKDYVCVEPSAADVSEGEVAYHFVRRDFWEKHTHLDSRHLADEVYPLLPQGGRRWTEEMESLFSFKGSKDESLAELGQSGFEILKNPQWYSKRKA